MNELALFAGAGGGILGGILSGFRTVCAVEIDPYCREILLRRQEEGHLPPFPIWDDIRTFNGKPLRGCVDVVTAGFPCQPFSTGSRGRIVATDLFDEAVRIVEEVQPRFILFENVQRKAFPVSIRGALSRIPASAVGAPHRRVRYWLSAKSDDTSEPAKSLDAEMAGIPEATPLDWWADGPNGVLGVDDGGSHRMDRLRALGNAQVPAVAALAWRLLKPEPDAKGHLT